MRIPKLNIRQKVALGVAGALVAMVTFGGFAAYNLKLMERKVRLVEVCDDFKSGILEARRYEKNYLLYGHEDDLRQAMDYLRTTETALDQAQAMAIWKRSQLLLRTLRKGVARLRGLAARRSARVGGVLAEGPGRHRATARPGQAPGGPGSVRLAGMERQRILEIIQ